METMKFVRLGVVIFLCKAFVCGFAEESSCTPGFESEFLVFKVHRDDLHQGKRLGRVIFNTCDGRTRTLFQSSDKRFDVNTDGTVRLKRQVTLHEGHKVFSVHAWDSSGKKHTVSVRVERVHHHEDHHMDTVMNISSPQMESHFDDLVLTFPKSSTGLKRAKRGWVIPPFNVMENSRGPFPQWLVKIKSDSFSGVQMAYSITGEGADLDPKGTFTVERLSGYLFVTRPLDRERKASYRIIVHATGVDVNVAEKPMEIIVNVMDQNDNNPVFTQNPFNGNVPEAAIIGHEFMTVTATDADDPDTDNAVIRYSLIKQDPESPNPNIFKINSVTGGIRVNSLGLDKEKWSKYTLTVVAADLEGRGYSTTGTAVITVTDSNDNAPQFDQTSRAKRGWVIPPFNVPENSRGPFPQWLVQIKSDYSLEAQMAYSITGEGVDLDPKGTFTIERLSGNLFVTRPLDRETKASYRLVAHATGVDVNIVERPMEIIVNVLDQNDNYPNFTQNPFNGRVPEAADKGHEFMTVTATDADDPDTDNGVIRYSIVKQDPALPNPNMFQINSVTGGIYVNSLGLDKEQWSKYTLVIMAADLEGRGFSTTGTAVITVTDSNDNAPQFDQTSRAKRDWVIPPFSVIENSRGPFPMKLVQIKSDYSRDAQMAYRITGEGADLDPKGTFTIERLSGNLYVTRPLDRERKASYRIIAHATGVDVNISEKPMEIIVNPLDQNDNKPVFTQNPFNGNVHEAADKGHEFMTVTATDADDPDTDNGVIRYSLVKQDPESPNPNMFQINSVTGGIYVNSSGLDREKWSKYTLTVVAADLEGRGFSTTGTAVITVTDSNDNAPQFDQTSHTVSVPENKVGAEVAKLTVTDGDEEGSPAWSTKYRIISGDKGGFFNVSTGPSQLEGVITTVKPLDFEKNKQYILSVIVENDEPFVGSLATSTATVTVNVEDVNEPPEFNPKEKIIYKPEDSPVDTELVSYTATDPDTGKPQKIMYKISNDPAGWLSVNQNTGLIKVRKPMDKESSYVKDGKYKAIILAVDDDKLPATGTGTLIIELSDVNDNAPVINERNIKICNRGSAPVLLSITDKDDPSNAGPFTVETQGETSRNWSAMMNDTSTGVFLKLKSTLKEGEYNVVLRVFDQQRLFQDNTIQATVFDCEKASFLERHSFCLR
ncbi:hypothetical protein ABG768_025958 [Culter alburnus]|uniref:Cadherin domain-containing protein n=1 Tax=Culter alburnus TaxID=194366 RepID=A0AAW2AGG1_CULAL